MMLDKLLARYAQEYVRIDADSWRLALTNGHSFAVSARRDDGFLLLDADTGAKPGGRATGSPRGALSRASGGGEVRAPRFESSSTARGVPAAGRGLTRRRTGFASISMECGARSIGCMTGSPAKLPGRRWLVRNRRVTGKPSPAA